MRKLIPALFLLLFISCEKEDYTQYVDTSIGVKDKRWNNCVIGPMLPYGSINPSPQTFKGNMDGYHPEQPIDGFGQLHVSGTGWSSYGHFLVQPQAGEISTAPGTHASAHSDDVTLPYLYATTLDRYGVRVEVAPSYYSAAYRFTFPASDSACILIDAAQAIASDIATEMKGKVLGTEIQSDGREFTAMVHYNGGWPYAPYKLYLAGEINKPSQVNYWEEGTHKGATLGFSTKEGEEVILKLAISFTGYEKAKELLRKEIPGWNFDKVVRDGRKAWNKKLSSIKAEFGSEDQKTIFYSALYRVFTMARDRSLDNSKWVSDKPFWDDNYAYWDTFRTVYPLLLLLDPDAVRGNILGMMDRFEHNGFVSDGFIAGIERIPEQGGNDVDCILADAYVKGLSGIDWEKAYQIVKFNADERRQGQTDTSYRALGWIPNSKMSVSKTLEYAYNDFCAHLMAKGLGHEEDAARYLERSHKWTVLWNPDLSDGVYSGFMDARNLDGSFENIPPRKYGGSWGTPFYEASAWTYNYFVPHDFDIIIELMGGREEFVKRLEYAFENKLAQYDNEPGFLISRAFVHAGRPDLSSKWVHHIMDKGFDLTGYPGNEDTGSMGSWHVFNSLGFCPNAGQDFYYLNAPAVSHAVIKLEGGKKLTIKANASPQNVYIASCKLNGKPVEGAIIKHSDIAEGGTLEFELSPSPVKASLFRPEGKLEGLSAQVFDQIRKRALERTANPGLEDPGATTQWWHYCSEYLTDAALVHAVEPSAKLDTWLHNVVMDLVRRPVADWSGPPFRYYGGGPMVGGLETAHLTWATAISLDMAGDLFSPSETAEIREALREKGMIPCKRYIDHSDFYHNWNCIIHAGFTVAAAVLGDAKALEEAREYFLHYALDHFQDDGSYGESLQYANYAAYGLMLSHEALLRSGVLSEPVEAAYFGLPEWAASARFYRKELSRWPVKALLPRSANFGDCAAVFRPSGDLLMHIASRSNSYKAGVASWMFDQSYLPLDAPAVHDMASFGFINDFGFLSVILAPEAAAPVSAEDASLPLVRAFSGGDAFLRESWDDGKAVLAFRTSSEQRHAVAHLHGDVNSIILSYSGERFLVDPGHACYRNISRPLDTATSSHNTCTFTLPDGTVLGQKGGKNRKFDTDPLSLGGKRLLCEDYGEVSVIANDAADLYGAPIREFSRYAILCGSEAVFVVDKIRSDVPVKTTWNWLLDNTDGALDFKVTQPVGIRAKRGEAVISLERTGAPANLSGPSYALVHDAYHTLPGQFCEGKPGSGMAFRFSDREASKESITVYTITLGEGPCQWIISVEEGIEVTSPEGKKFHLKTK